MEILSETEVIDAFALQTLAQEMFCNTAVAQDKYIEALGKKTLVQDRFPKKVAAQDIFVMEAVIILKLVEEM